MNKNDKRITELAKTMLINNVARSIESRLDQLSDYNMDRIVENAVKISMKFYIEIDRKLGKQ